MNGKLVVVAERRAQARAERAGNSMCAAGRGSAAAEVCSSTLVGLEGHETVH